MHLNATKLFVKILSRVHLESRTVFERDLKLDPNRNSRLRPWSSNIGKAIS